MTRLTQVDLAQYSVDPEALTGMEVEALGASGE